MSFDDASNSQLPAPLFPLDTGPKKIFPRILTHRNIARKCTFGCSMLDSFLHGGVCTKILTEISGESGAGKTQLCLQLSLTVQLPVSVGGLSGSAIYIYTEGRFPFQRLQELSQFYKASINVNGSRTSDAINDTDNKSPEDVVIDPCDNVLLEDCNTIEELQTYLEWRLPLQLRQLRRTFPVKLLIIDSIAGLFRTEFDNNMKELTRRNEVLFRIASSLKRYADNYGLAVVITNQVTDVMENKEFELTGVKFSMNGGGQGRFIPALGLGWANCVNTRLLVSKLPDCTIFREAIQEAEDEAPKYRSCRRRMRVIFSPQLRPSFCDYIVNQRGVKALKT